METQSIAQRLKERKSSGQVRKRNSGSVGSVGSVEFDDVFAFNQPGYQSPYSETPAYMTRSHQRMRETAMQSLSSDEEDDFVNKASSKDVLSSEAIQKIRQVGSMRLRSHSAAEAAVAERREGSASESSMSNVIFDVSSVRSQTHPKTYIPKRKSKVCLPKCCSKACSPISGCCGKTNRSGSEEERTTPPPPPSHPTGSPRKNE